MPASMKLSAACKTNWLGACQVVSSPSNGSSTFTAAQATPSAFPTPWPTWATHSLQPISSSAQKPSLNNSSTASPTAIPPSANWIAVSARWACSAPSRSPSLPKKISRQKFPKLLRQNYARTRSQLLHPSPGISPGSPRLRPSLSLTKRPRSSSLSPSQTSIYSPATVSRKRPSAFWKLFCAARLATLPPSKSFSTLSSARETTAVPPSSPPSSSKSISNALICVALSASESFAAGSSAPPVLPTRNWQPVPRLFSRNLQRQPSRKSR